MEDAGLLQPGEWHTDKGRRATTQRFTAEEAQNYGQILGETDRIKQGYGNLHSLGTFMNKDVEANMVALKNAWDNLLIAVAGPNSENVISMLQTLTGAINSVTKSVNGMDPKTLTMLGEGLAVLTGALVMGGAAALLGALGVGGWLVVGLTALAGALAIFWPHIKELGTLAWDKIAVGFTQIKDAIAGSSIGLSRSRARSVDFSARSLKAWASTRRGQPSRKGRQAVPQDHV